MQKQKIQVQIQMVACQIQTNLLAPSSAPFVYTIPDANTQRVTIIYLSL